MLRLLASRRTIALLPQPPPLGSPIKLQASKLAGPFHSCRLASTMAIEQSTLEWRQVSKQTVPPYSVYTTPVVKSDRDEREYRVIKLQNGLEAMLVHDAKAERAAASLDVAVGHLFDPVSQSDTPVACQDANSTSTVT